MPYPFADTLCVQAQRQTPMISSTSARQLADTDLAAALQDARVRTVRTFHLWRSPDRLGPQALPILPDFNPPAWEAGHIAWFQEFWLSRNVDRPAGPDADPSARRSPSRLAGSDDLYNSSRVAHALRWTLDLPDSERLLSFLEETLSDTLALLGATSGAPGLAMSDAKYRGEQDRALYFFRLALFHEDMHNEAAVYMANHHAANLLHANDELQDAIARADWSAFAAETHAWSTALVPRRELTIGAGPTLSGHSGNGFAFDNECPPLTLTLDSYAIDSRPVSVGDFLQFILDSGYRERCWWTPQGWQAQQASGRSMPRFHRLVGQDLARCEFGIWRILHADEVMVHVNAHEAEAWCAWAGRRLPSEAEWEHAAGSDRNFAWGSVWEWTAHAFKPYPGFRAHPYRDYSEPWFGTRRTLKGASFATHPRLRQAHYRNFFPPERADIFSGFRSCAQ